VYGAYADEQGSSRGSELNLLEFFLANLGWNSAVKHMSHWWRQEL